MHHITVQRIIPKTPAIPSTLKLKHWAKTALNDKIPDAEITIRITHPDEIAELNNTYRHKNKPTNVLSFPYSDKPLIGDIVICAEIVQQEAIDQHKTTEAHWAHMVVHGTLHLLGYDHETDADATVMETLEIQLLQSLGFTNPYHITEKVNNHE